MADKKISELGAAAALTGSELVPIVQSGVTVQTTAQDIADLAGGDFIPLAGTEVGSPVTGDIEMSLYNRIYQQDEVSTKLLEFFDEYIRLYNYDGIKSTTLAVSPERVEVNAYLTSRGIVGNYDFSANITDLDYTQKKYVDNAIIALDYGDIVDAGGVQNIQVYTTGTGTGTASVDLLPTIQIGKDVTVSDLANNASTHNIQIDAGVGNTILVAGSAPSQTITLNTNGASVTIRKITSTQFIVISKL